MRRLVVSPLLLLLLACTVHSSARRSVYRTSTTIDATGVTAIAVDNGIGSVRIAPATDPKVTIDLDVLLDELRPESNARKELASHLKVAREGGTIRIADAHLGARDASDWELRLVVHVPAGRTLTVKQGDGPVDIEVGHCAGIDASVGSGAVKAQIGTATGPIVLHGRTGEVAAVVTGEASGGADLGVENGTVTLTLPANQKGEFDAAITTGGLVVAPRYGLAVERTLTGGSVRGTVGVGGPGFKLRAVTGEIVLK